jgi:protein SCO1
MNSAWGPRRVFLGSVAAGVGWLPSLARGQRPASDHGQVRPPIAVPDIQLTCHDGRPTTLFGLVNAHATALQLMFTSCTTTCPIQGAIFSRVQKLIPDQTARGIRLLSVSVDPEHDTPSVLATWLRRFHGRPGWIAAAPRIGDLEHLRDFAGRGKNPSDNHTTQTQLFNRKGQLVWRTGELPDAEEIATILQRL